jgi:RNA polymerase sigma-70 factor (ECF subfamily)
MVFMPGGGRMGREDRGSALFPSPAGNLVKGDPVGTAGDVQRGDRDDRVDAEELFRGVYPKLAGWVRRLVDDDDTAHEIASEAFVRLLARWTRVDSPQSYLYMIATNLIRDHWRKTERERRAMRSVTASAALDPVAYPVQDVDVRNLIASLPPRLRDPFLLHYYGGFGIREVAAMLHRPEGGPVRGARQAEDGAGGTRWLTAGTTSTPGWASGSTRFRRRLARST